MNIAITSMLVTQVDGQMQEDREGVAGMSKRWEHHCSSITEENQFIGLSFFKIILVTDLLPERLHLLPLTPS